MYALVAVGFTLFFGVLDVIDFAHGDIFMLGAFAGLPLLLGLAAAGLRWPAVALALAFVGAIVITGLIGVAAERLGERPLARSSPLMTLLATLSLGLVLRESVLLLTCAARIPNPFRVSCRRAASSGAASPSATRTWPSSPSGSSRWWRSTS